MLPFGICIFCTSLGDGFAGIVGQLIKKRNPKLFRNKSLWGFVTNLVVSFVTALIFNAVFYNAMPVHAVEHLIEFMVDFANDNTKLSGY